MAHRRTRTAVQAQTHTALESAFMCLDGVPFVIGDKFTLPAFSDLEDSISNINLELLSNEYSFSTEMAVLKWIEDIENKKSQTLCNIKPKPTSVGCLNETQDNKVEGHSLNQNSHPVNFDLSCLTPVTVSAAQSAAMSSKVIRPTVIDKLDISLFEKVEDPFESLSLQTIDDLEELKNVLQPPIMNSTNIQSVDRSNYTNSISCDTTTNCVESSKCSNLVPTTKNVSVTDSVENFQNDTSVYTISQSQISSQSATTGENDIILNSKTETSPSQSFDLVKRAPLPPIQTELSQIRVSVSEKLPSFCDRLKSTDAPGLGKSLTSSESFRELSHRSNTSDQSAKRLAASTPDLSHSTVHSPAFSNEIYSSENDADKCEALGQIFQRPIPKPRLKTKVNSNVHNSTTNENESVKPGLQSISSVPPVPPRTKSNMEQLKTVNKIDPLPPEMFVSLPNSNSKSDTADENEKSWSHFNPLPPPPQPRSHPKINDDPYSRLSEEAKHFVDSLTHMGFPRGRVARAVEFFGQDDKLVVDYLCLVDQLTDKGYKSGQSEIALQLYRNDYDQACKYLDLFQQFQELGFSSDKIKEALLRCNINRDEALDILTAPS